MDRGNHGRKDRLIKDKRRDTYRDRGKWPESTLCGGCGALFADGHWTWRKPSGETRKATCPACRRIADHYPAGRIELKGDFLGDHRDEIINLIHNTEKQESGEHPLERIMDIENENRSTIVNTTGIHIARRIGDALVRSYKGDLTYQYAEPEKSIRVYWQR
jgi:hypothetical protein